MPHHTGTGLHPHGIGIFFHQIDTRDLVQQHGTFKVLREQEVAATTQKELWHAVQFLHLQQIPQLGRTAELPKHRRTRVDTKSVVRLKGCAAV